MVTSGLLYQRRMIGVLLALLICVILSFVQTGYMSVASAAQGSGHQQVHSKPNQPHYLKTNRAKTSPLKNQAGGKHNEDAPGGVPLVYNGGSVMRSTSTTYAIFWEPPTLQDGTPASVSPTYNSLIQRYFNDIGGSGLYGNSTQYYDTTGHIINSSTLGGTWLDTSPYPATDCLDTITLTNCQIDADIQAEITKAMAVNGWTGGLTHLFFVFTSLGEGSCFDATSMACSFSEFCGYHYFFNDSHNQSIIYANMPYTGTLPDGCGVHISGATISPNNDPDADSTINIISHEQTEAVTDPLLDGWHDSQQQDNQEQEIGDKCSWNFGTPTLDNGQANVEWKNHFYIVQQEWSNAIADCTLSGPMVIQQSSTIFAGSNDGNLYALNATDGTLLWQTHTGGAIISSPTIVAGVIYVGSLDGNMYAIKSDTGALLWRSRIGKAISSTPAIANKIVYLSSNNGFLYALNAASGRQIWHAQVRNALLSAPTVANNIIYVSSNNGFLYALNAVSGRQIWYNQVRNAVFSAPTVANNVVYVDSSNGFLYAFDATKRGAKLWSAKIGSPVVATPNVTNSVVYVGSSDGSFYALDATNRGTKLWRYKIGSSILAQASVVNGVIYFGALNHNFYALDATKGTLNWSYLAGDKILSSPAIANGYVYFGSDDHNLYALNATDGSLSWHYQTNGAVESSPTILSTS